MKCFIKITFKYRENDELYMIVLDRKQDGLPLDICMNCNW